MGNVASCLFIDVHVNDGAKRRKLHQRGGTRLGVQSGRKPTSSAALPAPNLGSHEGFSSPSSFRNLQRPCHHQQISNRLCTHTSSVSRN